MKIALVFLLLVVVFVIQDADSWRRRRRRRWFRAPRIRVRKIFRPIKKVIKKIRPVLKKVVKTVVKKVKAVVKPLLKPLQAKVCAPIQCLTGRDITWQTEHDRPVEGREAGKDLEQSDMMMTRRAQEMEDWLEKYDKEGRVLEGLNELVNTKRDVTELHQVLHDPVRSKRVLKYVSKALCGKTGGSPEESEDGQGPDQEVTEVVTAPYTVIEYVTAAPAG